MSAYRTRILAFAAVLASTALLGSGSAWAFTCPGASGENDGGEYNNTACGNDAHATASFPTFPDHGNASAFGQGSTASGDDSSAFGEFSQATGNYTAAFGQGSLASMNNSSAFGEFARATAQYASAFGQNSFASGTGSTAIGTGAVTNGHANSAAFGAGASATADNQQMFGTAANTYTMAGIASDASRNAQTGVGMGVVTSDSSGNLAVDTGLYNQVTQDQQGVAMAMALSDFWVPTGKSMAVGVNMGTWDGTWAIGGNIGGQIGNGAYLTGGVAVSQNGMVAGRAGGVFAW